jgi:segregation and condensation protein A
MYKLDLPIFEGPFELLLYFIRRDEIDIYDIPISKVTAEFLEYVQIIKELDLEMAGDFILMSSQLMYIKSQMLLPREVPEGEEPEDPRRQIVQSLLEYQRYKEVSEDLKDMESGNRYIMYRNLYEAERDHISETDTYKNATFIDLVKAYKKMLDRQEGKDKIQHVVNFNPVTIEAQVKKFTDLIKKQKRFSFNKVAEDYDKLTLVVSFLAILEMIRYGKASISQDENFEDIYIGEPTPEQLKDHAGEVIDITSDGADHSTIGEKETILTDS